MLLFLTLLLLPPAAHAVLFPDLAAKFETAPVYANCPAIGSGASQPEPALCADLKKPDDYCKAFHATPSMEQDKDAVTAKEACHLFYKSALESQHIFCDYQKDSLALQQAASTQAVDGAAGADGAAAHAIKCAQKIYGYYRQAALKQAGIFDKDWSTSKKILYGLADIGAAHIKAEVHCQKNGVAGAAPGYLLVGASSYGMSDQKQNYDNLSGSLARFSLAMLTQFSAAAEKKDQISQRQNNLGSIAYVQGMSGPKGSDITGTKEKEPHETDYEKKGAFDAAKDTAGRAVKVAVKSERNATGEFLRELFTAGAKQSGRAAAAEAGPAAVVGLGVTYLMEGKVTSGDVAGSIFTTGVGVVGTIVGAPAVVTIGATVGAGLIAEKIKDDFNAYDREVVKPYVEFAKGMVKQAAGVTSEQIAQAYQTQKEKLAYCSKCNDRDMQIGCPGMTGALHGLNNEPNAPSGSTEVFYNPWVNAAYQQYRARYPNGSTSPFAGPGRVSPVATAP